MNSILPEHSKSCIHEAKAENLSPTPRNAHLNAPILTLHGRGDLLPLPLQHELLSRGLGELVEAAPEEAEEALELLLRDVLLLDVTALDALLESEENELRGGGLGEDAGGGLALLRGGLGLDGVGGAVTSTATYR